MPPPNSRSCCSSERNPPWAWKRGRKPASANAALASANGLSGRREGVQLGVGAHAFLDAEINRAHDQFRALGELGEHLDGRLAVEVGGHVQHLAAVLDAVGRRVGPAAGQVEPDRAARPDDLVLHHVAAREGGRELGLVGDHLAQPGERLGLELLPARVRGDAAARRSGTSGRGPAASDRRRSAEAQLGQASAPAAKARAVASRSSRKKTLQRKFLSIGSKAGPAAAGRAARRAGAG